MKEVLYHIILIRELLGSHVSCLRRRFRASTLWGSGAILGLRVFYPALTQKHVAIAGDDLAAAFAQLSIHMPEQHDIQWACCLFFKSVNVNYARAAPRVCEAPKPWPSVAKWLRLLQHPYWGELRRSIASFGLEAELGLFEDSVRNTQGLRCSPEVSCRACLKLSSKSHIAWQQRGYVCDRQAA